MRILRSSLFYIIFYTGTFLYYSFFSPVKFFTTKFTIFLGRFWSKCTIYLSRWILGINFRVKGVSNIPKNKPFLLVSNHQSAWETFFFSYYFNCPVFILKKELKRIPIFSLYFKKIGFIFIDRDKKTHSLRHVIKSISNQKRLGKKIFVIFPEGTRTPYKSKPDLKPGIFSMYKSLNKPVVPIALNSGLYWPKNNKIKSGEILIEFKEPIQPGLSKQEFLDQLKKAINSLNH